jgi:thioredoxin-related protein
MKKIVGFLSFFLISSLAFGQVKLKEKAPLADVKMKNTEGGELSLNDAKKEKGLIVVFSCNTCPFVVGTPDFPGWERQYNELHELATKSNIGFVLVNSNEAKRDLADSFEAMLEHSKEKQYAMPYLVDVNSQLANALKAITTPHIYMFNADMELVYVGSIDNIWDSKRKSDEPYLKNAIQALGEGKKIKTANTAAKGCSIKRKM